MGLPRGWVTDTACAPLAEVTVVVDPVHIVRLANAAVTKTRRRVQQEILGHRGWAGDPANDRLRILLAGQNPTCKTQPVTSILTRRPRLVA